MTPSQDLNCFQLFQMKVTLFKASSCGLSLVRIHFTKENSKLLFPSHQELHCCAVLQRPAEACRTICLQVECSYLILCSKGCLLTFSYQGLKYSYYKPLWTFVAKPAHKATACNTVLYWERVRSCSYDNFIRLLFHILASSGLEYHHIVSRAWWNFVEDTSNIVFWKWPI